jgi:hypothetical protein
MFSALSDHLACFTSLLHIKFQKRPKFVQVPTKDNDSINKFCDELCKQNIYGKLHKDLSTDPNLNYNILHNNIKTIKEEILPIKTVKFNKYRHKCSPWITSGILASIHYRDNLYRKTKQTTPTSPCYNMHKTNLKTYNKILNKTILEAKKQYYYFEFDKYKTDIKNTWATINNILCRNNRKKYFPSYMECESQANKEKIKVTDKREIAELFNNYFTSIGPSLAASIKNTNTNFCTYLKSNVNVTFDFKLTSVENILKIINSFAPKNSVGYDELSMKLVKKIKHIISPSLSLIINQSLHTGIFPEKLKIAKVNPLYKKESHHILKNYRPISLLPVFSKIFEKVVFTQLYDYFHYHKLLYSSQYGYRKEHSTEQACIELVDRLINILDNNKFPLTIFIDLTKAFDTLDHQILLYKLQYYGVHRNCLSWFQSYLNTRYQYVVFDCEKSSLKPLNTGVPQGSVLGPLLFLIYINDLAHVSNIFHPILFADDTTLISNLCSFQITNNSDMSSCINGELEKIHEWMSANKLSVNIEKTTYIIFHRKQQRNVPRLNLTLNGIRIKQTFEFEFLGLLLTETLDWSKHISKMSSKISQIIGTMSRIKRYVPKAALKLIYNSLILSRLYYCILLWGFDSARLLKLQKRAVRIICTTKYNAHTNPLFYDLRLLKIKDIFSVQCAIFFYKFKKNRLPKYFENFFVINENIHGYNTRNRSALHLFQYHYQTTGKCVRFHIPNYINNLPANVKDKIDTHSLNGFVKYMKMYLIESYNQVCQKQNCYVCRRN